METVRNPLTASSESLPTTGQDSAEVAEGESPSSPSCFATNSKVEARWFQWVDQAWQKLRYFEKIANTIWIIGMICTAIVFVLSNPFLFRRIPPSKKMLPEVIFPAFCIQMACLSLHFMISRPGLMPDPANSPHKLMLLHTLEVFLLAYMFTCLLELVIVVSLNTDAFSEDVCMTYALTELLAKKNRYYCYGDGDPLTCYYMKLKKTNRLNATISMLLSYGGFVYGYVTLVYAVKLWKLLKGFFCKLSSINRRIPEEPSSVLSWRTVANALESKSLDDDTLVDLCKQFLEQDLSGEGSQALGISSASIGFQVESSMKLMAKAATVAENLLLRARTSQKICDTAFTLLAIYVGQLLISDSNFRRSFLVPAYITGHVPLNKLDMDNYDDLLTNTTWTKGTSIRERCEINPGDLYGRLIFVGFFIAVVLLGVLAFVTQILSFLAFGGLYRIANVATKQSGNLILIYSRVTSLMHIAAMSSAFPALRVFLEAGGNIDMLDCHGKSVRDFISVEIEDGEHNLASDLKEWPKRQIPRYVPLLGDAVWFDDNSGNGWRLGTLISKASDVQSSTSGNGMWRIVLDETNSDPIYVPALRVHTLEQHRKYLLPPPTELAKALNIKALFSNLEMNPELQLQRNRASRFNIISDISPFFLPNMVVCSYESIEAAGKLLYSGNHSYTSICDIPEDSVVVFFSQTWLRGRADDAGSNLDDTDILPNPDDAIGSKAKLLLAAMRYVAQKRGLDSPNLVYAWFDFACVDQQELYPWPFMAAINALPIYLGLCDEFVYTTIDRFYRKDFASRYENRVWCRLEQQAGWYQSKLASPNSDWTRIKVTPGNIDAGHSWVPRIRKRTGKDTEPVVREEVVDKFSWPCKHPAHGSITKEADRAPCVLMAILMGANYVEEVKMQSAKIRNRCPSFIDDLFCNLFEVYESKNSSIDRGVSMVEFTPEELNADDDMHLQLMRQTMRQRQTTIESPRDLSLKSHSMSRRSGGRTSVNDDEFV